MVIDRQYYDDTGGYLKFNGSRGNSDGNAKHLDGTADTAYYECSGFSERITKMMRKQRFMLSVVICVLLSGDRMASKAYIRSYEQLAYDINNNGEAIITGLNNDEYCLESGYLEIPEIVDEYRVVGITDHAFSDRENLHHVRIAGGVRYIGAYAFEGCKNLYEVEFGDDIQAIGEGAFRDTGLRRVVLPDSVMSVDQAAFESCSVLEQIKMPQNADISPDAFEDTAWQEERDSGLFRIRGNCLKAITGNTDSVLSIPYGITSLERGKGMLGPSIMDDISLQTVYEEIVFPDSLTELGAVCLANVKAKRIEIPNGVRYIPFGVFMYGEVQEIVLSEGIEVIGQSAFCHIDGLETVNIPASVQEIEDNAFYECIDLQRITIPGTVEKIGVDTFRGCESLTEIVYEEGIRMIGCGYADTQIKSIRFPESVVSIQGGLWRTHNLERVYIPAGAVDIYDELFSIRVKFQYNPITVYGQKGSLAEKLAVQSGYEFIAVESGMEMP